MLDSFTWLQWLADHSLFRGGWRDLDAGLDRGAVHWLRPKPGSAGTATPNVVLMARAFGAKESVGVVLPLLIVAGFHGLHDQSQRAAPGGPCG